MYQQTIRQIEAKAAKIRRRNIARAAAWVGAVVGLASGLVVDLTIRLPDPDKRPGPFLFITLSEPLGGALLLGAFFYACAVVAQTAWRVVAFMIGKVRSFGNSRDSVTDIADG